jgi:NADPH:quinone reductase-like Zn-dependent oxidoreductase
LQFQLAWLFFLLILCCYFIQASTVSYEDCMMRRGICFGVVNPIGVPATPGMDVVGIIVSVGEGVTSFNVGDRVAALVRTGGNARYINVPESDLVEVPKNCDAAEAVCMVSTFMTAYQSLRLVTNDTFILNDKRILITGGIEPVGQALIQLCFRAGAKEIYATAPNHRHRYVRTVLGARPLPVDPALWLETVKGTMDIVFDGTCYDTFESATASLNEDGTMISLGMSALLNREKPGVLGAPLTAYWAKLKSQIMSNSTSYEVWESFVSNKDAYKLDMEILFHLLKKKFIKPHICKRVALSEVAEAQDSLEKENARGDIVCLPWKRIGK